ncbi:hypothetical protein GCM10009555_050940 [Acrocarpospora macrocephala]|uniref:Glycine zipper domain-containing protein n=1 Tax=Acrocarpospora macrocephala TaxID=150177 RepID=A0A5M3WY12_9ACTN|nr:hypothetical protein [Acrocarpospora macrocephala]GES14377.1 hypothetical protein Amac_079740 [Acrocarpospora macrocephala]
MTFTTPQMNAQMAQGQMPPQYGQAQYGQPLQQGVSPMGIGGGMAGAFAGHEIGKAVGGDEGGAIGTVLGTILGAILPLQAQQQMPQQQQRYPWDQMMPPAMTGYYGNPLQTFQTQQQPMPMGGILGPTLGGPFSGIDPELLRKWQAFLTQMGIPAQQGQQGVAPMGFVGSQLGRAAGREVGQAFGGSSGASIGAALGDLLGKLIPLGMQTPSPQDIAAAYFAQRGIPFDPVQPMQYGQQSVSPASFGAMFPTMPPNVQEILAKIAQTTGQPMLSTFQAGQGGQISPMEHMVSPMSFWSKVAQHGMQYGLPMVRQILANIPDQPMPMPQPMPQPMPMPMPMPQPMQPMPMQPGQAPGGIR